MPLSSLTYYGGDLSAGTEAQTGYLNPKWSTISQNLDQLNNDASNLSTRVSGYIRYAHEFTGTPTDDGGNKIREAIADLGAAGGIVDARGITGAQTISSTITIEAPVQLLLGAATYTADTHPAIEILNEPFTQVIGAGPGTTIINADNAVGYTVSLASYDVPNGENVIRDLSIVGNSTASGGLISERRQGYTYENLRITGFTNAAGGTGVRLEGSNTGLIIDCDILDNNIGVEMVDKHSGVATANLHTFLGGNISANSWAVYAHDGSHNDNQFYSVNVASTESSPAIFIQQGLNFEFDGCYFEANKSGADTYSIQLGDSGAGDVANGCWLKTNFFSETNVAYPVNIVRGSGNAVFFNYNGSSGMSAIVLVGTNAAGTMVIGNYASSSETLFEDNSGTQDVFGMGTGSNFRKGPTGYVFGDAFTGDSAPVEMRAAVNNNNLLQYRDVNGNNISSINTLGWFLIEAAGGFASAPLDVSAATIRIRDLTAPAGTATGSAGMINIHGDHIYVCTSANSWKRVALSTF